MNWNSRRAMLLALGVAATPELVFAQEAQHVMSGLPVLLLLSVIPIVTVVLLFLSRSGRSHIILWVLGLFAASTVVLGILIRGTFGVFLILLGVIGLLAAVLKRTN